MGTVGASDNVGRSALWTRHCQTRPRPFRSNAVTNAVTDGVTNAVTHDVATGVTNLLTSIATDYRMKRSSLSLSPTAYLAWIVMTFTVLCLVYNIALPIFEGPDESSHFLVADYLARAQRLPDLNGVLPAHEAVQPPLYYALEALAIAPFDRTGLDALTKLNTDWFDKDLNADFTGVRGQHLRTEGERWPWSEDAWAVHTARLVSTLLGALTVVFVYLIARTIFTPDPGTPSGPALLAAALVAFNPKFIHVSSIVSNDIAISLAATVALWWLCRMLARGVALDRSDALGAPRSVSRLTLGTLLHPPQAQFAMLGGLIGLAVLCKLQGLALFAPALVALLAPQGLGSGWPFSGPARSGRHDWAHLFKRALALGLGFALTAGWYFGYNTVRYGNPLAWAQVQAANLTLFRQPPLDVAQIAATIPLWFTTYWGSLGVKLEYPDWINVIFAAGLGLAVLGCVVSALRDWPGLNNRRGLLALIVAELAVLALFVTWLRNYVATENSRLIFPAIAPVAVLVVLGWTALLPKRFVRPLGAGTLAGLAVLSLATPFTLILPAFATPQLLSGEALAAQYHLPSATPSATFAGDIRLMSAHLGSKRIPAGESLALTLYWGAARPINQSYRVLIEALDASGELIGRKLYIPFNGRFATQRWQADTYFQDEYALPIAATAFRGPARIQLSLFAQYPAPHLLPIDGMPDTALQLGQVKIEAPIQALTNGDVAATTRASTIATFGGAIRLVAVRTDAGHVQFDWVTVNKPEQDYTLFLHVLDSSGQQINQKDDQPFAGQYPTGLWDTGERVRDVRQIALAPEARYVSLGWYDASGQRLSARKADGSPWSSDTVTIAIGHT